MRKRGCRLDRIGLVRGCGYTGFIARLQRGGAAARGEVHAEEDAEAVQDVVEPHACARFVGGLKMEILEILEILED